MKWNDTETACVLVDDDGAELALVDKHEGSGWAAYDHTSEPDPPTPNAPPAVIGTSPTRDGAKAIAENFVTNAPKRKKKKSGDS
jgi:hypothetical protein